MMWFYLTCLWVCVLGAGLQAPSGFARRAPSWYLPASSARAVENPDTFMHECARVALPKIKPSHVRAQGRARAAMEATGTVLGVGETRAMKKEQSERQYEAAVLGVSTVITDVSLWSQLWRELPVRFRVKAVEKVFSTDTDGYNLASLFRMCEEECPTLMLIRTTENETLGVFQSYPWSARHQHKGRFFGNGDTFVFGITPTFHAHKWVGLDATPDAEEEDDAFSDIDDVTDASSGVPTLFMYASAGAGLCVGGGPDGYALQLDRELHIGRSHCSPTFRNPPLVSSDTRQFTCSVVEVLCVLDCVDIVLATLRFTGFLLIRASIFNLLTSKYRTLKRFSLASCNAH